MDRTLTTLDDLNRRANDVYVSFDKGKDWIGVLHSLVDPAGALEARGWTLSEDVRGRLKRRALELHSPRARSSLRIERTQRTTRRAPRDDLAVRVRWPGEARPKGRLLRHPRTVRSTEVALLAFQVDGERAEATLRATWGRTLGRVGGLPRELVLPSGRTVWLGEPALWRQADGSTEVAIRCDARIDTPTGTLAGSLLLHLPLVRVGTREKRLAAIAADLASVRLEPISTNPVLPSDAVTELSVALRARRSRFLLLTPCLEALAGSGGSERLDVHGPSWARVFEGRTWFATRPFDSALTHPPGGPVDAEAWFDLGPEFLAKGLSAAWARGLPRCLDKAGGLLAEAPPADLDPNDACPVVAKSAAVLVLAPNLYWFHLNLATEDWYTLGADIDLEISVTVGFRQDAEGHITLLVHREDEIDIPWVADLFWWLVFALASVVVNVLTGGAGGALVSEAGRLFRATQEGRIEEEASRVLENLVSLGLRGFTEADGNLGGALGAITGYPAQLAAGALVAADPGGETVILDLAPPSGQRLPDSTLLDDASVRILALRPEGPRLLLPLALRIAPHARVSTLRIASRATPTQIAPDTGGGRRPLAPAGAPQPPPSLVPPVRRREVDRWKLEITPSWSESLNGGLRQGSTRCDWRVDGRRHQTLREEPVVVEVNTSAGDATVMVDVEVQDVFGRSWRASRTITLPRVVVSGPDWQKALEDIEKGIHFDGGLGGGPGGPLDPHGPGNPDIRGPRGYT